MNHRYDAIIIGTGQAGPTLEALSTFTRFLSQCVRDRQVLTWSDAIAKTSYLPAKLLEQTAPQMSKKGRLQIGMDADITVFDPATVQDQATYERPNQISRGVKDLLVGGIFVIRNGALDTNAFPGQPVRRSGAPATSDDAHEQ